jgi:hypothetical protein
VCGEKRRHSKRRCTHRRDTHRRDTHSWSNCDGTDTAGISDSIFSGDDSSPRGIGVIY